MKHLTAKAITEENSNVLTAISLSIVDNGTNEVLQNYILHASNQVGNFSCPDLEGKELLDFVVSKEIYQTVLTEAVDGSRSGIELHIKNIRANTTDDEEKADLDLLAKLICVNYQVGAIPLFGFVTGFNLAEFTPKYSEACKKCTYKRHCMYYNKPKAGGQVVTFTENSVADTDEYSNQ